MTTPLLHVEGLRKQYRRAWPSREVTFSLEADFVVEGPGVIGVLGANGSGKTTLFELITGSNRPDAGRVRVAGQDIHQVRYAERAALARHYHQSYQVRSLRHSRPSFMLQRALTSTPQVYLFDEPQFSTQDGYIGFMLDFFRTLRARGRVVFLCVHPNEPVHLAILQEICERYLFVHKDDQRHSTLLQAPSLPLLLQDARAHSYLGKLAYTITEHA